MNEILNRYNINPLAIKIKNNIKIYETKDKKYVLKNKKRSKDNLYSYLETRGFNNFPTMLADKDYELYEYIDEIKTDDSQKLTDMIYLLTVLHNKTTFYKEIDLNDIKEIYETYNDKFTSLLNFYNNLNNMIETESYISPSSYHLLRNISIIYSILNVGKEYLNKWYEEVKNKKTLRYVLNHNNLKLNHLIESNEPYFISWNESDFGFNADDIANMCKNNYLLLDIKTIIQLYETKYKLYSYEYYYLIFKLCEIEKFNINEKEEIKIVNAYNTISYASLFLKYILENDSKKPKS